MKISVFPIILALAVLFNIVACDDKNELPLDGVDVVNPEGKICEGIVTEVEEFIEDHMAQILADLTPMPTNTDQLGHEANLNTVVERLNTLDCLEVQIECYACIETLPLISELRIKAEFDGASVEQIMDISTPDDGIMVYLSMHE